MSEFLSIKKEVNDHFNKLAKEHTLYYVDIDRDAIFERYLDGFTDPEEKQGHNCNCCKSFMRQWGGIVAINEGRVISIWDIVPSNPLYLQPIKNLSDYIHSLPVSNVFLTEQSACGTDSNYDGRKHMRTWNHFYIEVPGQYVNSSTIDSVKGLKRTAKETTRRALEELSASSVETVLDLIAQGSLYRGEEQKPALLAFSAVQGLWSELNEEVKENFAWILSSNPMIANIRNSALGTLLIDLSADMDLDAAVRRWENVMAPTNYKRPTALVTPAMIKMAKEKLEEMGLVGSLERRFANEADLNLEDILYVDKSSQLTDVFDDMAKDTLVNPRSFSKVEEVTIENFIEKVVPNAKSIEILVENSHMNNFVSLLTSQEKDAPTLFKWPNNFSWAYSGGITDAIKERVKAAGGDVTGVLRTSLSWHNSDDLDIHVREPNGNEINFTNMRSRTGGLLDVDMNVQTFSSKFSATAPVENVTWPTKVIGKYEVIIHNYTARETVNSGFTVQVEYDGQMYDFTYKTSPRNKQAVIAVQFEITQDGITFKGEAQVNTVASKEKWSVKTNQFTKVKQIMLSPNHWNSKTGNKHYMFFLDGAVNDEQVRPFFNEFLREEFNENRKVFEVLGAKVKVEPTTNQLSGVGFSETQSNHIYAKVRGTFDRVVKVIF